MESPPYRRTERVCVALYVLVAAVSALAYYWLSRPAAPATPGEPDPTVGVAFLAIGLFWLCVLLAAGMVAVLLLVNAVRARRGDGADRVVVALALVVPVALVAGLVALFYGTAPRLSVVLSAVALVVAPLALLAAAFGDRYRGVAAPE